VLEKEKDNATIDVIGEVRADGKFAVGHQRDTVKLALDSAQQVAPQKRAVQHRLSSRARQLSPEVCRARKSVGPNGFIRDRRANSRPAQNTAAHEFRSAKQPARSSGREKGKRPHPLVQNQTELVPNVTHVFTRDQHLYLQYEVYDAARGKNPAAAAGTNTAANSSANAVANGAANSAANGNANPPSSDARQNPAVESSAKDRCRVSPASSFCRAA